MRNLQFMSIKPELVVLNVGEQDLNSEKTKAATSGLQGFLKADR